MANRYHPRQILSKEITALRRVSDLLTNRADQERFNLFLAHFITGRCGHMSDHYLSLCGYFFAHENCAPDHPKAKTINPE